VRWLSIPLLTAWYLLAGVAPAQPAAAGVMAVATADTAVATADTTSVVTADTTGVATADTVPALPAAEDEPDTARVPDVSGSNGEEIPVGDACRLERNRRAAQTAVGVVFVGANVELFRRFKQAWWSGEKADRFFFRADWGQEFRDQDKFGHMWGGYHLTRAGHTLLRGACVPEPKAIVYSAVYATLFQLQIEIWDGYYEKYGFSYPDLIANTAGMGLAVLHAVKPGTEIVKPTISYRRTAAMKDQRPGDEIRYSIDYSGQTYWLSLDVDAALPPAARRYWPGIVRCSVGHSITDWILPREPGAPEGTPQQVVVAKRRLLLSLDLDAEKLPGNHPAWVFVKRQLGFIRLPAPALQVTPSVEFLRWYR
jgi:hypothetical protein